MRTRNDGGRMAICSCLAGSRACITGGFNYTIDIYMKGYIEIDREYCKGCELCVLFCPKAVIVISDELNANGYRVAACRKGGECSGCATCALVCPEAAIEVYRD